MYDSHHSFLVFFKFIILTFISPSVDALSIQILPSRGEVSVNDGVSEVTLSYYKLLVPSESDNIPFKESFTGYQCPSKFLFASRSGAIYSGMRATAVACPWFG
ncbi:hypothetical protein GZ78_08525 [Endozoicomonas numazuensis]|uniref:Uncharacterized protein n=1 Tax=Endozoicomonas numazuensis TaxID=1137799 RepID=A0A081NGZ9_9GAMM|nr:hypothetical protein GZ78_08525 [Endozoicomonas numazuensis]